MQIRSYFPFTPLSEFFFSRSLSQPPPLFPFSPSPPSLFPLIGNNVDTPDFTYLTSEMASRGNPVGLVFGLLIAIPSGLLVLVLVFVMWYGGVVLVIYVITVIFCLSLGNSLPILHHPGVAVTIAVTGGISSTLVGVAISAALLPPIVNSGSFPSSFCPPISLSFFSYSPSLSGLNLSLGLTFYLSGIHHGSLSFSLFHNPHIPPHIFGPFLTPFFPSLLSL